MWPDCDHVKMLYWKKKTNNRQNKRKIKLGLPLDFRTHSCEQKKCTYSNYWKLKEHIILRMMFIHRHRHRPVVNPGEGPSGPSPSFNFGLNWGRRAKKNFLGDCPPPLSKGGGPGPPPYLKVWIRHCRYLVSSPEALPLSYRRLMAGREIKLGTVCDRHKHVIRKAFKDCHP